MINKRVLTWTIVGAIFLIIVILPNIYINYKIKSIEYNSNLLEEVLDGNDPTLCRKGMTLLFPNFIDSCYNFFLNNTIDEEGCNKLQDNYKNECLANLKNIKKNELSRVGLSYDYKNEYNKAEGIYNYVEGSVLPPTNLVEYGIDTNNNDKYEIILYSFNIEVKKAGNYKSLLWFDSGDNDYGIAIAHNDFDVGSHTMDIPAYATKDFKKGGIYSYESYLEIDEDDYNTVLRWYKFKALGGYNNLEPTITPIYPEKLSLKTNLRLFGLFLLISLIVYYIINVRLEGLTLLKFSRIILDKIKIKSRWFDNTITYKTYNIRYETISLSVIYGSIFILLIISIIGQWDYYLDEYFQNPHAYTIYSVSSLILMGLSALIMVIRTYIKKDKAPTIFTFILANIITWVITSVILYMYEMQSQGLGFTFAIFFLGGIWYIPIIVGIFIALCYLDKIFKNIGKVFVSKKFYIILGLLILIVPIVFFIKGFVGKQKETNKFLENLECEKLKKDKADDCYLQLSKVQENINLCESILHISKKDSCYSYFAINKSDFKICEKVFSEQNRKNCYESIDKCYFLRGKDKENCITQKAIEKKDSNICVDMQGEATRDCYVQYAIALGEVDSCRLAYSQNKIDYCYYVISLNNRDSKTCSKISSTNLKNKCVEYSNYYYYTVTNKYCSNLEGKTFGQTREIFHSEIKINLNWTLGFRLSGDKTFDITSCPKPEIDDIEDKCYVKCRNICEEYNLELVDKGVEITIPEPANTNIKCHCLCKNK